MAPITIRGRLDLGKGMVGEVFNQDYGNLEVLEKIRDDSDVDLFVPWKWPGIGWKMFNFARVPYNSPILSSN